MAIPKRHASSEAIQCDRRTFFLTTSAFGKQRLLQSNRMAKLLLDTIRKYRDAGRFEIHEFVVMPDHLHLLLTVGADMTVERAAQFIKGGFSYRAVRELGIKSEIWQRGFSEVRILTAEDYRTHARYTRENPVRAGLASTPEEYPYCSAFPGWRLDPAPWPAAKAAEKDDELCGTTKVVP
jgi:putative transposase